MMNTTQLFVEQLLTGVLAFFAILLLGLGIADLDLGILKPFLKNESLVVIVVLSFSYPLGIFSDNMADFLLQPWDNKIKARIHKGRNLVADSLYSDDEITVSEVLRSSDSDWLAFYFTYLRKRIRVSRSMAFVLMLYIPGSVLVLNQYSYQLRLESFWKIVIGIGFTLLIGVVVSVWNWYNLTAAFHQKSLSTWEKVKASE